MRFIAALLSLVLLSGAASAAQPVTHFVAKREGGIITYHIAEFVGWEQHGDHVVIDGDCLSACTTLLGIVPDADICATEWGRFGFHSAERNGRYSLAGTQLMWFFYEGKTLTALKKHGWAKPSKHPDFVMIPATEIVQKCPASIRTTKRSNERRGNDKTKNENSQN